MAREEHDREDLMAEAVALVERAELRMPASDLPVVVGFRTDGSASFFFGPEEVYHFNARGQLRRAYCNGRIYKAESGRLAALERRRTDAEVLLLRRDLDDAETETFLAQMRASVNSLLVECRAGRAAVMKQVPSDADVIRRLLRSDIDWPAAAIADRPNVGG